ncbi:hypothetical protein EV121DRAFT_297564 [Schizophyllum commune]
MISVPFPPHAGPGRSPSLTATASASAAVCARYGILMIKVKSGSPVKELLVPQSKGGTTSSKKRWACDMCACRLYIEIHPQYPMLFLGYPIYNVVGYPRHRSLGLQPWRHQRIGPDARPQPPLNPDTPQNKITHTGNDKPYHLIFSDEFERDDRTLYCSGHDPGGHRLLDITTGPPA